MTSEVQQRPRLVMIWVVTGGTRVNGLLSSLDISNHIRQNLNENLLCVLFSGE